MGCSSTGSVFDASVSYRPCICNSMPRWEPLARARKLLERRNIFSIDHPRPHGGSQREKLHRTARWLPGSSSQFLGAHFAISQRIDDAPKPLIWIIQKTGRTRPNDLPCEGVYCPADDSLPSMHLCELPDLLTGIATRLQSHLHKRRIGVSSCMAVALRFGSLATKKSPNVRPLRRV